MGEVSLEIYIYQNLNVYLSIYAYMSLYYILIRSVKIIYFLSKSEFLTISFIAKYSNKVSQNEYIWYWVF